MAAAPYEVIDPFVLLRSLGNKLPAYRELASMFLEIAPPVFTRLEAAMRARDLAGVARESHTLRSTVVLVGAHQLGDLLAGLQIIARQQDADLLLPLLPEVGALFANVMLEVRRSIAEFNG